MAWRRPSDPNLAANKPIQAASEAKSARPSVPPTRGSIRFSGCGIKPSTLNRSLNTPAIELMAPLGLVVVPDPALGVAIAKRDPAFRLDSADGVVIGDEVSLAVRDGEFDHLSRRVTTREWSLRVLDPDMLHFADEAQLRVAHQNAGQKAGLAQDLEAIADAKHQSAARRVIADRPHDRRAARRSRRSADSRRRRIRPARRPDPGPAAVRVRRARRSRARRRWPVEARARRRLRD